MTRVRVFYGDGRVIYPTGMVGAKAPTAPEGEPEDTGETVEGTDVSEHVEDLDGGVPEDDDTPEATDEGQAEVEDGEGSQDLELPTADWTLSEINDWAKAQDPVVTFAKDSPKADRIAHINRLFIEG